MICLCVLHLITYVWVCCREFGFELCYLNDKMICLPVFLSVYLCVLYLITGVWVCCSEFELRYLNDKIVCLFLCLSDCVYLLSTHSRRVGVLQ